MPQLPAKYVLEVNGGWSDKNEVKKELTSRLNLDIITQCLEIAFFLSVKIIIYMGEARIKEESF